MAILFSYNLPGFSLFAVIACVLTFSWSPTQVMMPSGHAQGHVTHTEKKKEIRLPKNITLSTSFPLIKYFSLNIYIYHSKHRFFSFLKGQILRKFQTIEKFIVFHKKYDFMKEMHTYVPNKSCKLLHSIFGITYAGICTRIIHVVSPNEKQIF